MAREDDARAFGRWLLIGVDALIYASLTFMTLYLRQGVSDWPDVADAPSVPMWPLLLAAAAALAAAYRLTVPAAFVGALLVGFALYDASTAGLAFEGSRFGALFYAFGALWLVHLLGAALAGLRWRGPWLRRFLAVQGVAGAVLMAAVLV